MKQVQTKMFDLSDVGLDFCAGSKAVFTDRFKKILSVGYNERTTSTVSITTDQIILTYSTPHGYKEGRILSIIAGGGYTKEVAIDSVTENTVTLTDPNASTLTGLVTTKVASLGWELMYEVSNIHVYKMKHIDNTFRYIRICFQNNMEHRNTIAFCIGKTFDVSTGFITDPNALQATKEILSPSASALPRWDFSYFPGAGYNNMTYAEGYSTFGKAIIVGSIYHLVFCSNTYYRSQFNAILPVSVLDYEKLSYPMIIGNNVPSSANASGDYSTTFNPSCYGCAYIGNIRCRFDPLISVTNNLMSAVVKNLVSVLPSTIDTFNTTTTKHLPIYEHTTSQFLGYGLGLYFAMYGNDAIAPTLTKENLPLTTKDIDLNSVVVIHDASGDSAKYNTMYVAIPVEEVRID